MEKEGDDSTDSDDGGEDKDHSLLGSIKQGDTRFRAKSAGGDSFKGSTFHKASNDKMI